jgi:hypothetical protein
LFFVIHQMKHLKRSNSDSLEKESVKNANGMSLDTPVVLCDSDEVEHVLQPQGAPVVRMGTNIVPRNPDVEIAAIVLKDVPVTPESFRDLAKENDWYRFPFMVLQVGPPGFSTVPYTSTKKKGDKEESGLPLYETGVLTGCDNANISNASGMPKTIFHTFEKGKTNKDRGKRVSAVELEDRNEDAQSGNDGMQSVSVSLQPGQCMAHFLRSDDFGGKFFVDTTETLNKMRVVPAYSVVYMQVSSANVEQAKNGRMLKFKKMKVIPSQKEVHEMLSASMAHLPINREQFRYANECSSGRNWALRENMEKASLCLTANNVGRDGFVTDGEPAVLVQMEESDNGKTAIHAAVEENCIKNVLPHASRRDALKFLNIAIACGAVKALLRSNLQGDVVMDCNGDAFVYKVVAFVVDVNRVLALNKLQDSGPLNGVWTMGTDAGGEVPSPTLSHAELTMLRGVKGDFVWSDADTSLVSDGKKHCVVFRLPSLEPVTPSEGETELPESVAFVDKGCAGAYHDVQILVIEASKFKLAVESYEKTSLAVGNGSASPPDLSKLVAGTHCLSLELRPGNRAASGAKFKRMRLF